MVRKKNTINNNDKYFFGKSKKSTFKDKEKEAEKDLKQLHSKINLDTIKSIDSDQDQIKKKKTKALNKIYKYWVYIFKDGQQVKNFGVREVEINGIKLLIRTEKTNDELKVVFRELYPESRFDPQVVEANKNSIKNELNTLYQIERRIEKEIYEEGKIPEYNYELSDVKISILEKEVMLDSIKYGKSYQYFHDVRDDGIKCLFYEFENNGLRLIKKVKEKSLFTEASEVKQIESLETKRDIDEQLKKKDVKDWKKVLFFAGWIILFCVGIYGVMELLNYNHEREYGDIKDELEKTMVDYNKGVKQITSSCGINENHKLIKSMDNNAQATNELLKYYREKYENDGKIIIE